MKKAINMIMRAVLRAAESVWPGHPDKVADNISDAVLDATLKQDKNSRVACECLVKSNQVIIAGEITTTADLDFEAIARKQIREIGYVNDDDVFHADKVVITQILTKQSPAIAQGVDARAAEGKDSAEQGAGDQGMMYGYATDETPEYMPAPPMFSHRIGQKLARIRANGAPKWLRPDGKCQVTVRYEKGKPVQITNVVLSNHHAKGASLSEIRAFMIDEVIKKALPAEMLDDGTKYLINPTGNFDVGGPQADTGLTGRKIIVDTYGGIGRHGGGAFSGKDPSKVDRSAAYMGRYVAKNVVAAGLASRFEIHFAYAIGSPDPVSLGIDTYGTGSVGDEKLLEAIQTVFSFKPAEIIRQLDLLRPIYLKTTNYGHFGKIGDPDITWEKTDRIEDLKRAVA